MTEEELEAYLMSNGYFTEEGGENGIHEWKGA